MGARKSRQSRNAKRDRALRYGVRRTETRSTLPIIVVVCDDARTAVSYFNELKRQVKQGVTVNVVPASHHGATPDDVVEFAAYELKRSKRAATGDERKRDSVWALIDVEGTDTPERRLAAERAKVEGERRGVKVALSNPCYEVWTLLHLEDTGQYFQNCRAVVSCLERAWVGEFGEPFNKAQADYSRILGLRDVAARRAAVHRNRDDPSWTEVYEVVRAIDERVS